MTAGRDYASTGADSSRAPAPFDLGCYEVRALDGILQLHVGAPS